MSIHGKLGHKDGKIDTHHVGRHAPEGGKVRRVCLPRYISRAGAVKGDGIAIIFSISTQISGIRDSRVNHQLTAAVVAAQLETNLIVSSQDEARVDRLTSAAVLLVSHRLVEHHVACAG